MAEIKETPNTTFASQAAILVEGTQRTTLSTIASRNLIEGSDQPDILFGTPGDDEILAFGGDDTIFGTTGNDIIDGGTGFDTLDYTQLRRAVTLLPRGLVGGANGTGGQIKDIEKIVGAPGRANAIEGPNISAGTFFDIDLGANQLVVNNVPNVGSLKFEVVNFVNVTGTQNGDTIIGSNLNNNLNGLGGNDFLSGELGNDRINGGNGDDTLQGSIDGAPFGVPEVDTLTGGAGRDRFILGDAFGSFYKETGDQDFARITDFNFGEQIVLGGGDTYQLVRNNTGFDLFALETSQIDLIARVTFARGMTITSAGRPLMGASTVEVSGNATLDKLVEDGSFKLDKGQILGIFEGA